MHTEKNMKDLIPRAAEIILGSRLTLALTGAGISVDSGIPDFRSAGGLWSKYDPSEYASIHAFRQNPEKIWNMLRDMDGLIARANAVRLTAPRTRWHNAVTCHPTRETPVAIKVGDKMPDGAFGVMTDKGPGQISTSDLFGGKKVVLFAVPGAFTPTCSARHLPGFVEKAGAIKAKGVDTIACMSVNDVFVMGAWGKDQGVGDKVLIRESKPLSKTKRWRVRDIVEKAVSL